MNRWLAAACLVALSPGAHAVGRLADVEVIDRDTGRSLPTWYHAGEWWVAGEPGARYALAIANREDGRILAVTSVDGVDVLSGASARWDAPGYVFDAHERYEIAGWRKSREEIASFVFTPAPDSYAARTGRPNDIGVIGVALFRERFVPPTARIAADAPASGPAAPASAAEAAGLAPRLGTGHGERERSWIDYTDFARASERPAEIVRIRYDSYAHLVAMGIVHERAPLPARPEPFPDSPLARFVPDPPPRAIIR